jgi:tyrosine-specific transport protein
MSKSPFVGGVLLVAGTTIGAAILALPSTTGFVGFLPSVPLFCACYVLMLITASIFLDLSLSLPGNSNLISMAGATLGFWGKVVSWISYLLLLYSVEAAYIDGSIPLLQNFFSIFSSQDFSFSRDSFALILPLAVVGFLYIGTKGVDLINRIMVVGLFISYCALVVFLPSHISTKNLLHVDLNPVLMTIPVVSVAFGYHIVIPSLVQYCNKDKYLLKKVIVVGSFIPLIINLVFQFLSLGVLPIKGDFSLSNAFFEQTAVTESLALITSQPTIIIAAKFFSFFAIITSFLGVSLSLRDFLTDGLKLDKSFLSSLISLSLTLVPPLLFLKVMGKSFLVALQFAGGFVAILMISLPAAMAWNLKDHKFYQSKSGKVLLSLLFVGGLIVAVLGFMQGFGKLNYLVDYYRS